jgi:hypothetical protein
MTAKDEQSLRTLYANLMDEVKVRVDCIDRAVNGQTRFPGPIVREFCYGQLRMLCEVIALACLVAHGDIPATYSKRLGREWSAEGIFNELTKLRPHFYPIPFRQLDRIPRGAVYHTNIDWLDPMPLPKEALLELYGKTHQQLHRGNVRKLMNSATPIEVATNFPEIISWAQRINDQLACHIIAISEEKLISCVLRSVESPDKVQVAAMMKMKAPPPWQSQT